MSSKSAWYVKGKEGAKGPFSSKQMKALAAAGKLRPKMQVRRGEDGRWVTAGEVKGLFPDQASAVEVVEVEPLEVEPLEVEPLEVVEEVGLDELVEVEPLVAEVVTPQASADADDLFAGDALSMPSAPAPNPAGGPAGGPSSAFAGNPYEASSTGPHSATGSTSGLDADTAKRVNTVIKDADQFWIALVLCVLCTGIGSLIICPWYLVRLSQWSSLGKSHPQLLTAAPKGSLEDRFQRAKSKLVMGIVAGAILLFFVGIYVVSLSVNGPR